jgi:glycosyltransferase involved in cell wall biosynthesis
MSNSLYKISYIISTKNRLPFLKIIEQHILVNLYEDEEIVVVDANSTDGSKEYLQSLFNRGLINQFISEPDQNQAEGWNKALLLARGQIIKKVIDDDVFDLSAIRKCADWMIKNPEIDFCISDCLQVNLNQPENVTKASRLPIYLEWKNKDVKSFTFSDVYLLIRKSTLARFGLFDTQFRMLDWEYSLRCSYLQANIAYYTGCMALAVSTPGNVTSTSNKETLVREGKIGELKYEYAGDRAHISLYSEIKIFAGKTLNRLMMKTRTAEQVAINQQELIDQYEHYYTKLKEYNNKQDFEKLYQ